MKLFGPTVKRVHFNPVVQAFEGTIRHRTLQGWEEFTARAYLPISAPYDRVCSELVRVAKRRNEELYAQPNGNVVRFQRPLSAR